MPENPDDQIWPARRVQSSEPPWLTIVSALLFLYVGFWMGLTGISGDPIYDGSITALVWGARIVGIGLLVVAALSYAGLGFTVTLDLVMSAIAALGCLAVGAIWLLYGDMQGVLLLLFGFLNAGALRSAWERWKHR